jgi:tetratricopeptide (TPR) repeat protein
MLGGIAVAAGAVFWHLARLEDAQARAIAAAPAVLRAAATGAALPAAALAPAVAPPPAVPPMSPPAPAVVSAAPWQRSREQAFRDSLYLALASGDSTAALDLAERWLGDVPGDTLARRAAARLATGLGMAEASRGHHDALLSVDASVATRAEAAEAAEALGQRDRALSLYGALIADTGDPVWHLARARVHVAANALEAAVADVSVAAAAFDVTDAWQRLGDLEAWRGDPRAAIDAYRRAMARGPSTPTLVASLVRAQVSAAGADLPPAPIDYDAVPDEPEAPATDRLRDRDEGVQLVATSASDNAGYLSTGLGVGAGWSPDAGVTTWRVEADRRTAGLGVPGAGVAHGWRSELGLARRLGDGRIAASLGRWQFAEAPELVTWHLGAEGRRGLSRWRAELSRRPAFDALRAGPTLGVGTAGTAGTAPLAMTGAAIAASLPLPRGADAWVAGEAMRLQDGNARTTVTVAVRAPLRGPVSLLMTTGALGFSDRHTAYWTPSTFAAQGMGLEAQWGQRGPLAVAARVVPAVAWVREAAGAGLSASRADAIPLVNGGLDAAWRTERLDVTASGALGQDRGGRYRAAFASVRATVRW